MTFESITSTIPGWLCTDGPESLIVVSSRARIARNISGIWYAHRADEENLDDVVESVLDAADIAGFDSGDFLKNSDLDDFQKTILIERHLISPTLASKNSNCGVLVKEKECCSIMVNEEDHLRIQYLRPGYDPMGAFKKVTEIEKKLSEAISFSFSKDYGYLTACPTNMGTGLRVSVLIHLPALVLTKDIQRVIRSTAQLGLAVRGYRGEGSDVVGNLFQISNQTSFARTEQEIVQSLETVVENIIEYEKNAANVLIKEAKQQIEDKIWRSLGILQNARLLSTHEFMNLASAIRLGLQMKLLNNLSVQSLNEMMILTQPGHLQEHIGKHLEPIERDIIRANIIRERFVDLGA